MDSSDKKSYFSMSELIKDYVISDIPIAHQHNLEALKTLLDAVREEFGKPIVVTSGYRNEVHNKRVGGAKASQHLTGKAADIRPQDSSKEELDRLYEIACKHFKAVGDGRSRGFVHVDTRDDKERRWDY